MGGSCGKADTSVQRQQPAEPVKPVKVLDSPPIALADSAEDEENLDPSSPLRDPSEMWKEVKDQAPRRSILKKENSSHTGIVATPTGLRLQRHASVPDAVIPHSSSSRQLARNSSSAGTNGISRSVSFNFDGPVLQRSASSKKSMASPLAPPVLSDDPPPVPAEPGGDLQPSDAAPSGSAGGGEADPPEAGVPASPFSLVALTPAGTLTPLPAALGKVSPLPPEQGEQAAVEAGNGNSCPPGPAGGAGVAPGVSPSVPLLAVLVGAGACSVPQEAAATKDPP